MMIKQVFYQTETLFLILGQHNTDTSLIDWLICSRVVYYLIDQGLAAKILTECACLIPISCLKTIIKKLVKILISINS